MEPDVIEHRLGYHFRDREWMVRAFTHPSMGGENPAHSLAYERLEYLGDAVLELVVSTELFKLHPAADEGELTKRRAALVSRKHLAHLAGRLGWGDQLVMSPQLEKIGGRSTLSILANTFESIIGAVMMDAGYEEARRVSLHLLQHSLQSQGALQAANPKGELQERLQALCGTGPTYQVLQLPGMPPAFEATALWQGREIGHGRGSSKHKAEVDAASHALERYDDLLAAYRAGE